MVEEIAPADLSDRIANDDDDTFVLDIQRKDDYDEWHIPSSENVDIYDELQNDPETAKDALSTLPENVEVVIPCTAGPVSERAAQNLHEMGYDVKTLACTLP